MWRPPNLNEDVVARLRQDFLDDATERLDRLDNLIVGLSCESADPCEVLAGIRRDAHNFKGMGESFGFPSVTVIAHRLESYLSDLQALAEGPLSTDVQSYLDRLRNIIERGTEPEPGNLNEILSALPIRSSARAAEVARLEEEVLLVTANKVVGQLVENDLLQRGYHVVMTGSSLEAVVMVIRNPPDLVIASAVLDDIGGVDLARALAAIRATQHIPFVLLTSFDRNHRELKGLPDAVTVARTGSRFDDDMSTALTRFGLLKPGPPAVS